MKKILTIILIFISQISLAQYTDTIQGFSVGLNPLDLLAPVANTLEIVTEYKLNENYSFLFKAGLPVGKYINPLGDYFNGTELSEDGKYFKLKIGMNKKMSNQFSWFKNACNYFGFELMYVNHNYQKLNSWYKKGDDYFSFEAAKIKRKTISIGFVPAVDIKLSKRFNLNYSTSLGLRYVNDSYLTTNELKYIDKSPVRDGFPLFPPDYNRFEGGRFRLYLSYSIRLMYSISKN